ncbi:MAG: hypothetical protein LUI87_10170, partial [Lachnospiraceae bacterium]|nr:hypothetical protein [Lachnospiraceae bacterium]
FYTTLFIFKFPDTRRASPFQIALTRNGSAYVHDLLRKSRTIYMISKAAILKIYTSAAVFF